jgi:hypothetical protein
MPRASSHLQSLAIYVPHKHISLTNRSSPLMYDHSLPPPPSSIHIYTRFPITFPVSLHRPLPQRRNRSTRRRIIYRPPLALVLHLPQPKIPQQPHHQPRPMLHFRIVALAIPRQLCPQGTRGEEALTQDLCGGLADFDVRAEGEDVQRGRGYGVFLLRGVRGELCDLVGYGRVAD